MFLLYIMICFLKGIIKVVMIFIKLLKNFLVMCLGFKMFKFFLNV